VERDERDEAIQIAQAAMVDYCDQTSRDQIALLDPLPGRGPLATRQWLAGAGLHCERGNAAYYYPWVEVRDARTGEDRIVPPSGHIAGVWARNDAERGVHHSPANLTITGALNVELPLGEQEQATLNREGINCIRAFPGRGIKVWGARTLARDAGEWQYLSVRRLMTYIERLVERQMDWAVFEPNDPLLWERITRYLGALLTVMWREGRLAGSSPDQAFRVKCDAELNTDATVRLGQIITDIRVAPLKPAEFISFRVLQWHGSGSRT
jgi:phage tail sheath protein FI